MKRDGRTKGLDKKFHGKLGWLASFWNGEGLLVIVNVRVGVYVCIAVYVCQITGREQWGRKV